MQIDCYIVPVRLTEAGILWFIRDMQTSELLDWAESITEAVIIIRRNQWTLWIGVKH